MILMPDMLISRGRRPSAGFAIAVGIPVEYLPALNPANHHMVHGANGIYA